MLANSSRIHCILFGAWSTPSFTVLSVIIANAKSKNIPAIAEYVSSSSEVMINRAVFLSSFGL